MVTLAQREFFPKPLAKYNCSGLPAFKCQRYRVEENIIPSLSINMQKSFNQSAQFIKSFVRYTWFKSPTIFKTSLSFDHSHSIIIKVTFSFHEFVSARQKSTQSIDSFSRYSRFYSQDLKDHAHFFIEVTFGFPERLSTHQKPVYSINSFLRYSQF